MSRGPGRIERAMYDLFENGSVLDEYEERAAVLEFDLEIYRPDAETTARREAIHG